MNSLTDPKIAGVLRRLHEAAGGDREKFASLARPAEGFQPSDLKDVYIAVSASQGRLLYALARATSATNIVEFGTSFGISAVYLGAAARDNGGTMVTTEIEPAKIEAATANIREAGLDEVVQVLGGNVLETLADHAGPIDFVFLDGWNDLYIELIHMLGPRLKPGALIAVDNANFDGAQEFLGRMRDSAAFVSSLIEADKGAMEVACYTGPWKPI